MNDYRNFISFINDNRKFYPMFAEWAATVDFIKKRKVKPGEKPVDVEEAFPPNDFLLFVEKNQNNPEQF